MVYNITYVSRLTILLCTHFKAKLVEEVFCSCYGVLYSLPLYLVESVKIEILYVGSVGELQDSSLRAQILVEETFVCVVCIHIYIYIPS